jgi:hypothetical protein
MKYVYNFDGNTKITLFHNKLNYVSSTSNKSYYIEWEYCSDLRKIFHNILLNNTYRGNNNNNNNNNRNSNPLNNHPKWKLYSTLKETITKREDQLKSGEYNESEKKSLMNELNNAKGRAKQIKEKYKF